MRNFKVLIPTAGIGSRLGGHCDHVNKALVPVANRPIISHIIEKLPPDVELIIDLGHKGELVQEFLTLAYPERKFTFVWANRKGLTADLCDYRDMLQCPFVFVTNDAIVIEDVPPPDCDWVGYADVRAGKDYRSVVLDSWDSQVVKVLGDKGSHVEAKAYIGICGINSYKAFWASMDVAMAKGTKSQGESFALAAMVQSQTVKGEQFTWYDTGTAEALAHANKALAKDNEPNILPKEEEHIWFCDERVIKFSTDEQFIAQRVQRADQLVGYVPEILGSSEHMYCYQRVPGQVLSETVTPTRFKEFLEWIEKLWSHTRLLSPEIQKKYYRFYHDKTFSRVADYFKRFGYGDTEQYINGARVPRVTDLLRSIDWEWMSSGIPVWFHGDLHFENVIDAEDHFSCIDWRQHFAGSIDYGDIYYDFAKIWHGLIVSHGIIRRGLYSIDMDGDTVNFELLRRQILIDCERYFKLYLENNRYDRYKVEVLTALIFLNIAALHHQPYAEMLFHLGKTMLYGLLEKEHSHGKV